MLPESVSASIFFFFLFSFFFWNVNRFLNSNGYVDVVSNLRSGYIGLNESSVVNFLELYDVAFAF